MIISKPRFYYLGDATRNSLISTMNLGITYAVHNNIIREDR